MSIGLLLITHNNIGSAMLDTASHILGICPLNTNVLPISDKCDPDPLRIQAQHMVDKLNQGDGVLVLTDLYGSTPSNIARSLRREGVVEVVAGMNLPMLLKVLNYSQMDLYALKEKALSGAHTGILSCPPQGY